MLPKKSGAPASGLNPNAKALRSKAQGWTRFLYQSWAGNGCAISPAAGRNSFRVVWNRIAFPDI
jgi:hypothetical protein